MKAKEYLLQVERVVKLINIKQKEIDKLRLMTEYKAVRYDIERVSGGTPTDRTDIICKIVDYEIELKKDIEKLVELKKEIIKTIETINNADYVTLLYLRYFEFKTWEEISIDMHFSYRWVLIMHGRALNEVEKLISQ